MVTFRKCETVFELFASRYNLLRRSVGEYEIHPPTHGCRNRIGTRILSITITQLVNKKVRQFNVNSIVFIDTSLYLAYTCGTHRGYEFINSVLTNQIHLLQ